MPLFVILCTDNPGVAGVRVATRDTHLAYLRAKGSPVRMAGALLGEDGAPTGSLITIEAADKAEAQAFAAADPYAQAGLFETVTIQPWRLAIGGG